MARELVPAGNVCSRCPAVYPPVAQSHGWQVLTTETRSFRSRVAERVQFFRLCPPCAAKRTESLNGKRD